MSGNSSPPMDLMLDPKFYLEKFCKIKTKGEGLAPFILNEPQKDLFNTIKKNNRVICLKARQIGFCCQPSQKILTADLRWIKIDDVQVGTEIVAVDEECLGGTGSARKMRKATVQAKWDVFEKAFKFTMEDGRELVITGKHRMLCLVRGGSNLVWKKAEDFKIGELVRSIAKPWGEPDVEDGWFAGMMDGEGSLSKKDRTGASMAISQVNGPVWQRLLAYAASKGFAYRVEVDERSPGDSSKFGAQVVNKLVLSRMSEIFQALGQCRPARFINRDWWVGKKLPGNGSSWLKVVSIEELPSQRMIDLQTSEKTFILEGMVSHNSTAVTGYAYHYAITHPGVNVALVGYNSDLTKELLDKVKTFYRTTPDPLKPTLQYNSKFEISFPKIESKIMVLPSTEYVGRGYTIHFALLTELAFWENAEEKMSVLEASVPVNGKIIIESTPNLVGDHFHRMWMADNGYAKREYGWWWHYSQEEVDQIAQRLNNPMKFAREYSLEFMSSGRSVFDIMTIKRQRKNVLEVGDKNDKDELVTEEDGFRTYRKPEDGKTYVVGADVAEGVVGGDFSSAVIFDRATGEEVAFYRGLIAPDRFAQKLDIWGRKYNNALMVFEVNSH